MDVVLNLLIRNCLRSTALILYSVFLACWLSVVMQIASAFFLSAALEDANAEFCSQRKQKSPVCVVKQISQICPDDWSKY